MAQRDGEKERRLAEALRVNLRRRKAQAREAEVGQAVVAEEPQASE